MSEIDVVAVVSRMGDVRIAALRERKMPAFFGCSPPICEALGAEVHGVPIHEQNEWSWGWMLFVKDIPAGPVRPFQMPGGDDQ